MSDSHRETAIGIGGKTFTYIVPDMMSPPRLIDRHMLTRVIGYHETSEGAHCPCCNDPMGHDTSVWVEHTTWGEPFISSVCSRCAAKATL